LLILSNACNRDFVVNNWLISYLFFSFPQIMTGKLLYNICSKNRAYKKTRFIPIHLSRTYLFKSKWPQEQPEEYLFQATHRNLVTNEKKGLTING